MYKRVSLEKFAAGWEGEDGQAGLGVRAGEGLNGAERDQYIPQPA
jgi:hypothetical protein